jgi:hypothetical protein
MKFQCKYSGSVYEFTQEHDIKSMLTHPDYSVYEEKDNGVQVKEEEKEVTPKRGRPSKQVSE